MNRRGQYKFTNDSVSDIRQKQRTNANEICKQRRYKVLKLKRIQLNQEDEENVITELQVKDATEQLLQKKSDKKKLLLTLCKAFAQSADLVDTFLGVENSLSTVVGILSGHETDHQFYAAWCLTNIASGSHEHTLKVVTSAGPYFVTYLQSGNAALQEQCCWAAGNIAGDGQKCRKMLVAQGAIPQLIKLLQSPRSDVCQSSAFALSNLAQGGDTFCRVLLSQNIFSQPKYHLSATACSKNIDTTVEVAWMYFYTISGLGCDAVGEEESCIDETVSNFLISIGSGSLVQVSELITPLIRCIGCFACSQMYRQKISRMDGFFTVLRKLLNSSFSHIRKETLWALSNLAVDGDLVNSMFETGVVSSVMNHILSPPDTLKELLYCLCNVVSHNGSAKFWLIQQGLSSTVLPFLQSSDHSCVILCVQLLCLLSYDPSSNSVVIDETILSSLETLQYHRNMNVQKIVCDLLHATSDASKVSMDL